MLRILYDVLERIVPALGGTGGSRDVDDGGAPGQPQGQAELPLRNAFKMTVYLLFSAAFPAEECYSSAKQVSVNYCTVCTVPAFGDGDVGFELFINSILLFYSYIIRGIDMIVVRTVV